MKDYCYSCDKKKEGSIDDDPELGNGNFYCFKCANDMERSWRADIQRDYDWYNSLDDEQKAEVKCEYALAGVKDFPP